jgi:hypothetical protein
VATAELSGTVTGQFGVPLSGVTVTLTGTDNNHNPVTVTATTNAQGVFDFSSVPAGTYTLDVPPAGTNVSTVGTDNGNPGSGTVDSSGNITDIVLAGGDTATGYSFQTILF